MLFAKSKLSSNGIFIRPKFPREALCDNHDWRASLRVRRIKKPAFDQRNLHRRKIIGGGGRKACASSFPRLSRPPNGFHFDPLAKAAEWNVARRARPGYPRQRTKAPHPFFPTISLLHTIYEFLPGPRISR